MYDAHNRDIVHLRDGRCLHAVACPLTHDTPSIGRAWRILPDGMLVLATFQEVDAGIHVHVSASVANRIVRPDEMLQLRDIFFPAGTPVCLAPAQPGLTRVPHLYGLVTGRTLASVTTRMLMVPVVGTIAAC